MKRYIYGFCLIITAFLIIGCFSPWSGGGNGSLSIVWSKAENARLVHREDLSGMDRYEIELRGPGNAYEKHELSGAEIGATFSVVPGTWTVTLKGQSLSEGRYELQVFGIRKVEVKAGEKKTEPIDIYNAVEVETWQQLYEEVENYDPGDVGDSGVCPLCGIQHEQLIILKSGGSFELGIYESPFSYGTIAINRPVTIIAEGDVSITRYEYVEDSFFSVEENGCLTLGLPEMTGTIILDGEVDLAYSMPLIRVVGDSETGKLIMNDGVIVTNNLITYGYGGGIYVGEKGDFTMKGGSITGNTAGYGGGVYVESSGAFTMEGGSITGNYVDAEYGLGSGVYVEEGGTYSQTGGTISGNKPDNIDDVYIVGVSPRVIDIYMYSTGDEGEDFVSFPGWEEESKLFTRGRDGDIIDIYYTLDNTDNSNVLRFPYINVTPPGDISTPGSGKVSYTVNSQNSSSEGWISIMAEFIHTLLPLWPINFSETTVTKTYGDGSFTIPALIPSGFGTVMASYESDEPSVADVNAATGEVTIYNAGEAIISATMPANSEYLETTVSYRLVVNPKTLTVTVGDPSRTLIPFEDDNRGMSLYGNTAEVEIGIEGILPDDLIMVNIGETSYGFSGSITFINDGSESLGLEYNGYELEEFPFYLPISISDNAGNYAWVDLKVPLDIRDGQPSANSASYVSPARRIPVTGDNILAFNGYALMDGLHRHYILTEDIELPGGLDSPTNWTPIHRESEPFFGSFDGGNHTISGLTIEEDGYSGNQGMFGIIGKGAEVINLTLDDVNIMAGKNTGAVAGTNYGTIDNCTVTGTISGISVDYLGDVSTGGITGVNFDTVKNCSFKGGSVYGMGTVSYMALNIGGIAGYNMEDSLIEYCYFTATAGDVLNDNVGGIAGINEGTVKNCYSSNTRLNGNPDSIIAHYYAGGIVGSNNSTTSQIENCYSAIIAGYMNYAGGIAGNNIGSIQSCVALNPNIRADNYDEKIYGRITTLSAEVVPILNNNYARQSMLFNDEAYSSWENGADTKDGANITRANWSDLNWWRNTAGFNDPWWTADRLPLNLE